MHRASIKRPYFGAREEAERDTPGGTHMTKNTMIPTRLKEIETPDGPTGASTLPEPTSRPRPMIPPIAARKQKVGREADAQIGVPTDHLQVPRLQLPMRRRRISVSHFLI